MPVALAQSMRRIDGLLQAGRYREAHAQLETLVTEHPGHVEGLRLLAGTKRALGDGAQAEALLVRALAIDPTWTPALTALAELLLNAGRGAEAVPLLERAVGGAPPYPRAALLLVRHWLDTGRPAAALAAAAPWCNGAVDAELAGLHVAAHAALGRQREAVAHYRDLVAAAPDNPATRHALATALMAAGQPEESECMARRALSRPRPTAALYHTHARSLIALERFAEAEQALRDCIGLAPRHVEAHDSLAQLIWMRTGNIVETTSALDHALERFEHDEALRASKAGLLLGAGDARGAYACLAPHASRSHASPALLIRTGLAALEFEPGIAVTLAQRALRAQPGNPTARNLLCAAYLGVGDGTRALAECAVLLEANPDDQYLIAMQTTALRLLNDPRHAALCDYDRMVMAQSLDTPSGWADFAGFLTDLIPRLNALHNPHGHRLLYQSLRRGTETTQDLSRSRDPVIRALFEVFVAPIARYREFIGQGGDALRRRNRGTVRFNGSWSVRLHTGGYHTSHVHPRGWISSACYLQLPDSMAAQANAMSPTSEGMLSFGTPGLVTTPSLSAEFALRPAIGQLVLFPSYFWHGTLPFHSDQPRLTVAFDVVPDAR